MGSQEFIHEEQHGKMAEDESGFPIQQQGEVNGHQIQMQCQEFIVENGNVAVEEYKVTEQQTECGQKNQEPIQEQNSKVIDYQNGSSKPENEQKDEVNGQKNQSQIQVTTESVDIHNVAEQTHEVTEEQETEVTEQQRDHGQQSQDEQNSKVIDRQDGYSKQPNEQLVMSVEKKIDAKLKYKAPEDQSEEPCQSKEQRCEVTEEHIEGIKRQIQFQEEVVEEIDKLTRPEAQQVENVSELQEQIELRKILNAGSMQESFSKKQEKAAAIAVNSTPLTSQKLPYHSSSTFSRENCLELLRITHKLQEKTHRVQESLLDLLTMREFSHTTPNPFMDLEERTMPIAGSCGEKEYMDCRLPAQMKHHQLRQLRPWGKKASESDCRVSNEPNCQELKQEQQQRDPVQEKSQGGRKAFELSCQTQQQSREPAQQRELPPEGQRQSKTKSLVTICGGIITKKESGSPAIKHWSN
ncbi:putative mediator of RNA polymerase II transcription subunit 26 [Rosa chinensis]|uniref:putative mediator of RNA polymerase II transcription subunit 26 n=1 Tax=Rosa chinensis TaxID=74649 RepID=UPI001AD93F36|nr:putative mediator of RNA polymerase II transcription subunit 26 [Rosa chinensis]